MKIILIMLAVILFFIPFFPQAESHELNSSGGFTEISRGACFTDQDVNIIFNISTGNRVTVWIKREYDILYGEGTYYRLIGFTGREYEVLRINLDKDLSAFLGKSVLIIRAKLFETDPDDEGFGYAYDPKDEDNSSKIRCNLNFNDVSKNLFRVDPNKFQKVSHPSLCTIENYDFMKGKWVLGCTASLVSPNQLLTAGHCYYELHEEKTRIRCGGARRYLTKKSWESSPGFIKSADDFDDTKDTSILTLKEKTKIKYLNVSLSKEEIQKFILSEPSSCVHYGFGERQNGDVGVLYKSNYSYPDIELGGRDYVVSKLSKNLIVSNPSSITIGDSGGPLICTRSSGEEVIVGVHSFVSLLTTSAFSALTSESAQFLKEKIKR